MKPLQTRPAGGRFIEKGSIIIEVGRGCIPTKRQVRQATIGEMVVLKMALAATWTVDCNRTPRALHPIGFLDISQPNDEFAGYASTRKALPELKPNLNRFLKNKKIKIQKSSNQLALFMYVRIGVNEPAKPKNENTETRNRGVIS